MKFSRVSRRPRSNRRRGVEAVEAAITLPLLMIVMFSTIQITHRWHVEKLLKIATYEAIKVGAAKDGGGDLARETFEEHAEALGIKGARLLFNQTRFDSATTGPIPRNAWCGSGQEQSTSRSYQSQFGLLDVGRARLSP